MCISRLGMMLKIRQEMRNYGWIDYVIASIPGQFIWAITDSIVAKLGAVIVMLLCMKSYYVFRKKQESWLYFIFLLIIACFTVAVTAKIIWQWGSLIYGIK